jgi:HEXXH motif-containing protein
MLSNSEFAALARGNLTKTAVAKLVAIQAGKHRLLVESVRRHASRMHLADGWLDLDNAFTLLSDIEAEHPRIVAGVIALPQVGGWAIGCLRRMTSPVAMDSVAKAELRFDLGYLAAIAATAGILAGHPFELRVPLRGGKLLLPGRGVAQVGEAHSSQTVLVRLDVDGPAVVTSKGARPLPVVAEAPSVRGRAEWIPVPRIRVEEDGLALELSLNGFDPFLAPISDHIDRRVSASISHSRTWRARIEAAWRILVAHHRVTAEALTAVVSTLVPLTNSGTGKPRSATSGWTFGAIGLSLPDDDVKLAEMFTHELHHLVLGALEDVLPLVTYAGQDRLFYSPFRDDPRPSGGLLHGCYAFLGVTAFWRRSARVGSAAVHARAAAQFARWRSATLKCAEDIAQSATLTAAGQSLSVGIRSQLVRWRAERVPDFAERFAADLNAEHRTRWRLNHLHPDSMEIQAMARAWRAAEPAPPIGTDIAFTVEADPPMLGRALALLLEASGLEPAPHSSPTAERRPAGDSAESVPESVDGADAALIRGEEAAAIHGYLERLDAADDAGAWLGLAVALNRSSAVLPGGWLMAERPELIAALHAMLRRGPGDAPSVAELVGWLSQPFETRLRASGEHLSAPHAAMGLMSRISRPPSAASRACGWP